VERAAEEAEHVPGCTAQGMCCVLHVHTGLVLWLVCSTHPVPCYPVSAHLMMLNNQPLLLMCNDKMNEIGQPQQRLTMLMRLARYVCHYTAT
jgi:hypothetical protein